ncbi:MAG: stage III sporulation protein AA [Vallitaleaceae bacterium]|nr:stage III sporulation protein AA [Vallitaleaceae bacterium]
MNEIEKVLPEQLKGLMSNCDIAGLQEIRLRVGKPILIYFNNKEFFIGPQSKLTTNWQEQSLITTGQDIKEVLEAISQHSLYAFEEDIKGGYITIDGGHRIGLAGKVVLEAGRVKTIRNVSCVNIRISHEVKGCADRILPYLIHNGSLLHTLIISPPKCGKTTLLRDLIRQVSNGSKLIEGMTVGVVDERSELGGCYRGIPQNDLGIRTDILDSCSKGEGLLMLIRAMAPKVIAVDEIGSKEDVDAIEYALSAGCKIICTLHAESLEELKEKPRVKELMAMKLFKRYIFLENQTGIGDYKKIMDENHQILVEINEV